MRNLRRYLSHAYYWRRAGLRIVEAVTRRRHLETDLDRLLDEHALRIRQVDPQTMTPPGSGIRLLYVAPKFDYGNPARGYSYEENHFLRRWSTWASRSSDSTRYLWCGALGRGRRASFW